MSTNGRYSILDEMQDIARLLLLLDEAMTTTLPPWRERQIQQDADAIRDSWEVQL